MRVYEDIEKEKRKRKPVPLWQQCLSIGICIIAALAFFVAERQTPPSAPADKMASELVLIPGGTFNIGTTPEILNQVLGACDPYGDWGCYPEVLRYSTPEIEVHLATFYIEKTEVTYAQYIYFLNGLAAQGQTYLNGCQQRQCIRVEEDVPDDPNKVLSFDGTRYRVREGFENKSVYGPSWYGAAAYCESIGRRLPTNAEWERAARGNDKRIYPWGNTWDDKQAESDEDGASPYGVQDMAGGLAEWVSDWWQPGYYTALSHEPGPIINPTGPETGVLDMKRTVRGRSVEVVYQWPAPAFLRSVGDTGIEGVSPGYNDIVTIRCAKDY